MIQGNYSYALLYLSAATKKCIQYINGDDDLPVCAKFDDETWEESFFQSLTDVSQELSDDAESDAEDLDLLTKLHNFQEAIESLEDV